MRDLQEGIYYGRTRRPGDSICIVFLEIVDSSTAKEVSGALAQLWLLYRNLKDGKISELEMDEEKVDSGNLTVLIGYGPELFSIENVRHIPDDFDHFKKFNNPSVEGGGPILDGSSVKYSSDVRVNPVNSDHIMLQFVGDNEFITSKAVVETWKILSTLKNSQNDYVMFFSRIFTGFQRNDNRSWLGFHDGISNLATDERLKTIAINGTQLSPEDVWVSNGTYLGFMRLEINLDDWKKVNREIQELIIGRDKVTGCPIIDIDKYGRPIKDNRCPIIGSTIIESGNETIRGSYTGLGQSYLSQRNLNPNELQHSHIARARVLNRTNDRNPSRYRIFRQGFEYFEPINYFPGFRVGLNFISFQNSPSTLFAILKEGFSQNNIEANFRPLEDYFSVRAAGIFLVPPLASDESFPGDTIFTDRAKPQEEFLDHYRKY